MRRNDSLAIPPGGIFTVALDDNVMARERLARFLALEHSILPEFQSLECTAGRIVLHLRRGIVPGHSRRQPPAGNFLEAASAVLFFSARGFPLEFSDFDGGPSLAALPASASRDRVSAEPLEATLSALMTRFFTAGGARRGSRLSASEERLFERLLARDARPPRPEAWIGEIFDVFPQLGEADFASARRGIAGFRPAGFDRREHLHRARLRTARLVLEGRSAHLFIPGKSSLLPGEALRASLGLAARSPHLAEELERRAGPQSHWICFDPELWDLASVSQFQEVARRGGVTVETFENRVPRLLPDELRDAVWMPAPDLQSSVALYEALSACAFRSPEALRRQVAQFLASDDYAQFWESGTVPGFLAQAAPDQARRDLALLSRAERRAVGFFLARGDGALEGEVDRAAGESAFARAARELSLRGWVSFDSESGPQSRRWHVADISARADLLASFTDEEVSSFCRAWIDHVVEPADKLDMALRSGQRDLVQQFAAEVFTDGAARPELACLARRAFDLLREEAPPGLLLRQAREMEDGGDFSGGRHLLETALARTRGVAGRREVLMRLARLLEKEGESQLARQRWGDLLTTPDATPGERAAAFRGYARLALSTGDVAGALRWLDEAAQAANDSEREQIANAFVRADLFSRQGDFEKERRMYEELYPRVRRAHDPEIAFGLLTREGRFLSDQREHAGAAVRFAEAVEAAGIRPAHRGAALMDLAISLDYLGEAVRSETNFRLARDCFARAGLRRFARRATGNLAHFLLVRGRLREARELLDELAAESEREHDAVGRLTALGGRARVNLRQGRFPEAAADRKLALELCQELDDRLERAELEIEESDARLFAGDREGALLFARRAASRPKDRGPSAELAAGRVADLDSWQKVEPARAFDPDKLAGEFEKNRVVVAERLARARAFFGPVLAHQFPAECARAAAVLRECERGEFADVIFSSPELAGLDAWRGLRAELVNGTLPLRLVDEVTREVWRSGEFVSPEWSRPVVREEIRWTIEGSGPGADIIAFLFETIWPPDAGAPRELPAGDGLAVLRREGIIAADRAMEALGERLLRMAGQNVTVFVSGESGTGKEKIARAIHRLSPRAQAPFVALNVAAFPEHLLEDELFGHVRGAFTGADRDRAGMFEAANAGTLFLDEIGDLAPALQAKLLRVLQEREIKRLGENRYRPVDARLISATARSLEKEVEAGRFREDLYYRVKVATLALPPLRERGGDVLLLANHFLEKLAAEYSRGKLKLTPRAAAALRAGSWPGNVRQLENLLREICVLADENAVIDIDSLPENLRGDRASDNRSAPGDYRQRVDQFRRGLVLDALSRHSGNRTRAARELGLTRQALLYLIRELGARDVVTASTP